MLFHLPSPEVVLTTNVSLWGWGAHCRTDSTRAVEQHGAGAPHQLLGANDGSLGPAIFPLVLKGQIHPSGHDILHQQTERLCFCSAAQKGYGIIFLSGWTF